MYDAYSCGFDGVILRPKRAHTQQTHIFTTFFACHRSHGGAKESWQLSEPDPFGVTLGSLWGQFGYLWVTLGHLMVTSQSLWSHFGYMKVCFQKTIIFPTDLNESITLLAELWVDLGLLWDYFLVSEGDFGSTLRSL